MTKFFLGLLAVALLGCSAQPSKTRYYTLTSEVSPQTGADTDAVRFRLAVGPITVPEALDRPQLVMRDGNNRYVIADEARWAEPLKREIPRVLAENLARQLPGVLVAAHTQHMGRNAAFAVLVDVQRFESRVGADVKFEANWSIVGRDGRVLVQQSTRIVEPVFTPGVAALVAAHGRALGKLGVEIAAGVKSLPPVTLVGG